MVTLPYGIPYSNVTTSPEDRAFRPKRVLKIVILPRPDPDGYGPSMIFSDLKIVTSQQKGVIRSKGEQTDIDPHNGLSCQHNNVFDIFDGGATQMKGGQNFGWVKPYSFWMHMNLPELLALSHSLSPVW